MAVFLCVPKSRTSIPGNLLFLQTLYVLCTQISLGTSSTPPEKSIILHRPGANRLSEKTEVKEFLITKGYEPEFGARPIKRYIQDRVETALADLIVRGSLSTKATYLCTLDKENNIVVQQQNAA